ncbi:MAG: hypothetical protein ACPGOY_01035 [Rhodospirillaceae bacterium]
MLQEKKSETDAEKQKILLQRLLGELSRQNPELYYQSTSEVARQIKQYTTQGGVLNKDEGALMARLSNRDVEVLLSLH